MSLLPHRFARDSCSFEFKRRRVSLAENKRSGYSSWPAVRYAGAVCAILSAWLASPTAQAAISYGTSASIYSQNFDSLPNAAGSIPLSNGANAIYEFGAAPFSPATQAGMAGWSFQNTLVAGGAARFLVSDGTSPTGAVHSFGTNNAPDRALGSLASNSNVSRFGLVLTNDTGAALTSFTVAFTGEEWRSGASLGELLEFSFATGPNVDLATGTFTNVPALNFASLSTGANAALDGNAAPNRTVGITATITGINWQAGQRLVVRWSDVNGSGNDDGLAVDDFSFTAVPEPSTWAATILALAGAAGWHQRRRLQGLRRA